MTTVRDVLQCDVCRAHIRSLSTAWVLWDAEPGSPGAVTDLAVVHAGACAQRTERLWLSVCLDALAHPAGAVDQLAHWHVNYDWPAEHAKRLALLAWAASTTATAADRRASRKWMELRRGWG